MASSSFAPMRRYSSSCRPALLSKNHFPPLFTSGTGKGQSSFPTSRNARVPALRVHGDLFFSRASAAKSAARLRSCANSPLKTTSSPSGPKISVSAATSKFSAALTSASAACCGVSKRPGSLADEASAAGRSRFRRGLLSANRAGADRHAHAQADRMQTRAGEIGIRRYRFHIRAPVIVFLRSGRLPAPAAATSDLRRR